MSFSPYPRTRYHEDTSNAYAEEVVAGQESDLGEVEFEVKGDGKRICGEDRRKSCGYDSCEADYGENTGPRLGGMFWRERCETNRSRFQSGQFNGL
jgi:hypothetical protein